MRTALYKAFDDTGALLYVGIATNWGHRWAQHSARSQFFHLTTRLEVSWFDSRDAAIAEEDKAISELKPVFNKKGAVRARSLPRENEDGGCCDRCGCFWGSDLKRVGDLCRDWWCQCEDKDCYPLHACVGLVRPRALPPVGEGSQWAHVRREVFRALRFCHKRGGKTGEAQDGRTAVPATEWFVKLWPEKADLLDQIEGYPR